MPYMTGFLEVNVDRKGDRWVSCIWLMQEDILYPFVAAMPEPRIPSLALKAMEKAV